VEGPFMHLSEVSAAILGKAAIPTVSLSGWDETPSGTLWRRAVPRLPRSASSFVSAIRGSHSASGCACWTMDRVRRGARAMVGQIGPMHREDEAGRGRDDRRGTDRRSACGTIGWTVSPLGRPR
jgi:hypothetical protein